MWVGVAAAVLVAKDDEPTIVGGGVVFVPPRSIGDLNRSVAWRQRSGQRGQTVDAAMFVTHVVVSVDDVAIRIQADQAHVLGVTFAVGKSGPVAAGADMNSVDRPD